MQKLNIEKNRKISNIFIFICVLMLCSFGIINVIKYHKNINNIEKTYSEKIDSLNHSIDSLENCISLIKPKIDTIYKLKVSTKYIYEKKADSIWNQSANDDWNYYTNFLSTRFPSDSCSIKTN